MKKNKKLIILLASLLLLAGCGSKTSNQPAKSTTTNESTKNTGENAFPTFEANDFEGNAVDNSLFSKNAVTVVNFWFNGCDPCVEELPKLNALNEKLKKKGAELIGINVEAGNGETVLKESKKILEKQGATYRNLYFSNKSSLLEYSSKLEGFPTTFLIDRNGNIVGDPILGSIDDEDSLKKVNQRIDEIIAKDKTK
ncbi:TlpA family protein disulfide reductase [Anaerosacchariphilus polymeriproducens]|uniref:TlpA family protein disulfide reductase n=1 Tax=Anaerosacchariphilus polymeriproducens TaxID=1812858 RepID=A0A371B0D9_9FIRM|nr:TlpA disulfide reductase family protein [Anaerosacchariphilus polymeriproducens]RDU25212.1 TlpA family protein disulfide reductase [Anaerosacchariphilus polymeriproducens]